MISLIFALLGLASSALSSDCPPDEAIFPCWCNDEVFTADVELTCNNEGITQADLQRIMQTFDKRDTLAVDLTHLKLGKLPSGFFQNVNVKKLDFWYCELESLAEDGGKPLTGLENSLKVLTIWSSVMGNTANFKLDLSHMKQLKHLLLSSNSFPEIDDWFKNGPSSLEQINLVNNSINKIGQEAFAGLENLVSFNFQKEKLGIITRSMLPNPANELTYLELKNNALNSLPEDMFAAMPALKEVILNGNSLKKIPKETFETIYEQLDTLDLTENPLDCDSHLEWIVHKKSPVEVSGTCQTPSQKKGVYLNDLISGKVSL